MLDIYAAMMAYGRQNCIIIPAELISVTDGRISLDEKQMLGFVEVFRRHGFQYFESPHLMYRGDEDDWGDPELKVYLTKRRYGTAEAKKDVDTIVTLIKELHHQIRPHQQLAPAHIRRADGRAGTHATRRW